MDYKITGVSTSQIQVEYSDGSWANIPIDGNWKSKTDYLKAIKAWSAEARDTVAVTDNPIKIGDEGVVGDGVPDQTPTEAPKFTWKQIRSLLYPSYEQQQEAFTDKEIYSNTKKWDVIVTHIAMVKEKVAKEPLNSEGGQDKNYTWEQFEALETECKADSRSYWKGDFD